MTGNRNDPVPVRTLLHLICWQDDSDFLFSPKPCRVRDSRWRDLNGAAMKFVRPGIMRQGRTCVNSRITLAGQSAAARCPLRPGACDGAQRRGGGTRSGRRQLAAGGILAPHRSGHLAVFWPCVTGIERRPAAALPRGLRSGRPAPPEISGEKRKSPEAVTRGRFRVVAAA